MDQAADIAGLLQEYKKLDANGAASTDHPDHDRRGQILDELQDTVGLGGRMVMDGDILERAEKLLGNR